jgi:hypothetical protein
MDRDSLLLMDELWHKNGKAKKSQGNPSGNVLEPCMLIPKDKQLQPDWNRIPSKNATMSDEEFEEAIRALALADAERGMKMGNAGKGILAGEMAYCKLLTEYISVVSPDRKAAYENFSGKGDTVYGSFNQEMLTRGSDGVWQCYYLTKEEMARSSKFGTIYLNAMKEYEAEHGQIPYGKVSSSSKPAQDAYSLWSAYNPSAYPSIYNKLA